MMWWWTDGGPWIWALMGVMMVAFWAVVVWVIWRILGGSGGSPGEQVRPEEVLAQRFAQGEIDDGEYRNRLAVLRASTRPKAGR